MRYLLNEDFALRGYLGGKEAYLLNLKTLRRNPLSDDMLLILKMCDGKTDFKVFAVIPYFGKLLSLAEEKGWARPAESGEALKPEQRYVQTDAPDIWDVQWSVTGKCNARCRHCFVRATQERSKDLTTDEMLGIIEQLGEHEIPMMTLSGGEPLIRPDLPVLLEAMQKQNIHVTTLSTNGFCLTDEMLNMFEHYGMYPSAQISFDGAGCHDWMRGTDGAEKMAINAMDVMRKRGWPFTLAMCVHKGNIGSIAETVRLAAEKGAASLMISFTDAVSDFSYENGVELISLDELAEACLDYLPVFVKEKPDIYLDVKKIISIQGKDPEKYTLWPIENNCTHFEENCFCSIVKHSFYISSEGRVLPCMTLAGTPYEEECLKLTEHSLTECLTGQAYSRFLNSEVTKLIEENPECEKCPHLHKCGLGCRGDSLANHLGIYGIDKRRCDFFMHGWEEKIHNAMDKILKER